MDATVRATCAAVVAACALASCDFRLDLCGRACADRECGVDACGRSCGTCGAPAVCASGICCVPDCSGRECGSDGCGGECPFCTLARPLCEVDQGVCVPAACTLPTTWGDAGVVASLEYPGTADADFIKTRCPDYSGDGDGDNGQKSMASSSNPYLKKLVEDGGLTIVLEFRGTAGFEDSGAFELARLEGAVVPDAGDRYRVDFDSYALDQATGECSPRFVFEDATIVSGRLTARASKPMPLLPLVLPALLAGPDTLTSDVYPLMEDARLEAILTDDGATASDGVIAGIWSKTALDAWLAELDSRCREEPSASCSYLGTTKAFLALMFDLDLDKDGKKDAASVCARFTLKPGTIVGLKP